RGDVDLAFQQRSELMNVPGIEIIGPLPDPVQAVTVFSAGICSRSTQVDASRRLIDFLNGPNADTVKQHHGMERA
ncbi:MAG: substrate-binding domain-containing protein, partial [Sphingomonadales bacterium]|nr:substrate-binding domain-containing protein [Sphingomonadales bacterium]